MHLARVRGRVFQEPLISLKLGNALVHIRDTLRCRLHPLIGRLKLSAIPALPVRRRGNAKRCDSRGVCYLCSDVAFWFANGRLPGSASTATDASRRGLPRLHRNAIGSDTDARADQRIASLGPDVVSRDRLAVLVEADEPANGSGACVCAEAGEAGGAGRRIAAKLVNCALRNRSFISNRVERLELVARRDFLNQFFNGLQASNRRAVRVRWPDFFQDTPLRGILGKELAGHFLAELRGNRAKDYIHRGHVRHDGIVNRASGTRGARLDGPPCVFQGPGAPDFRPH